MHLILCPTGDLCFVCSLVHHASRETSSGGYLVLVSLSFEITFDVVLRMKTDSVVFVCG